MRPPSISTCRRMGPWRLGSVAPATRKEVLCPMLHLALFLVIVSSLIQLQSVARACQE